MRWFWVIALVVLLGLQTDGLVRTLAQPTEEPGPQEPDPQAATLSLTPAKGRPGSTVTASGTGYCGSVVLRWEDETPLNSGGADEHGDVSITFTVPRATPGQYTVTSSSDCGGASASFEVVRSLSGTSTTPEPPAATSEFPPTDPPDESPPDDSELPWPPTVTRPAPPTTAGPPTAPVPPWTLTLPTAIPGPRPTEGPSSAPQRPPLAPDGTPYQDSTLAQYEGLVKQELESGVILYNPPEQMRVGVVYRVEVRIAREEVDELTEGLKGTAEPRVEQLLVGTMMRAKLEGRAFDIVLIGSDIQQLAATGFREWRWDVTPTASGNHPLFFTVSVLHEEYPTPIEEKVLERRVDVAVNPGYALSRWLPNNWEKLVAALVGVIGVIEGSRRLWFRRTDDGPGGVSPGRGSAWGNALRKVRRALRKVPGWLRSGNRA